MNDLNRAKPLRCLAVWLAVTATTTLAAIALLPIDLSLSGRFDELLQRLGSAALVGCAAWLWATTSIVVVSALRAPAQTPRRRIPGVPAPMRRLVLAACGVALTTGVAAPALATPAPVHVTQRDHSGRVMLIGLPFPDRATADQSHAIAHPATGGTRAHRVSDGSPRVVVRPGDSLWSIAASHLPAGASNADVATAWHHLYDRNRVAIGDDPDVLVPGQHLVLPPVLG